MHLLRRINYDKNECKRMLCCLWSGSFSAVILSLLKYLIFPHTSMCRSAHHLPMCHMVFLMLIINNLKPPFSTTASAYFNSQQICASNPHNCKSRFAIAIRISKRLCNSSVSSDSWPPATDLQCYRTQRQKSPSWL